MAILDKNLEPAVAYSEVYMQGSVYFTTVHWECSRFTKLASPRNARLYYNHKKDEMPELVRYWVEVELNHLGLWES